MDANRCMDSHTAVAVVDGHGRRVALYTELMLRELARRDYKGLKKSDILPIKRATLLHDIGKCFIPTEILMKKGRLTDEEFSVVKLHTVKGAELISECEDVLGCCKTELSLARDIALCHHERWDGAGYPYGLSGNQIPVAAQVVSLADRYDAMRSNRCYKNAYSHATVVRLIMRERGNALHPAIVDTFLDIQNSFSRMAYL